MTFLNWFRQKPAVEAPSLSTVDYVKQREQERAVFRADVLRRGRVSLTATCNVGPGTDGWMVHQMVDEGLLVGPTITRSAHGPNYDRYVYTVPTSEAEGEL